MGTCLASLFNRTLIIKTALAPECVVEEQDKGEKAHPWKEPEDSMPIESRCQYTSKYGSKSLVGQKKKKKIHPNYEG